jgi:hypothetical protein
MLKVYGHKLHDFIPNSVVSSFQNLREDGDAYEQDQRHESIQSALPIKAFRLRFTQGKITMQLTHHLL